MHLYLLLLFSLFSSPKEEVFCSCREPEKITIETVEDYDLILRGKVQKLETINHTRQLTFEIEKLYKGDLKTDTVTVSSPVDLSMCGLNIGTEGEWLLFAYKDDTGSYSTNSCTRSGDIDSYLDHVEERVKDDLLFLDQFYKEKDN